MDNRFPDFGDLVVISTNAPNEYRPGDLGDVCGMRADPSGDSQSLYLIEFRDGEAIEVPSRFVLPCREK